jgi:hypothetical protein
LRKFEFRIKLISRFSQSFQPTMQAGNGESILLNVQLFAIKMLVRPFGSASICMSATANVLNGLYLLHEVPAVPRDAIILF